MTSVFRVEFVRKDVKVGDSVRVHSCFGDPWQDFCATVTKIRDDGKVVVQEVNGAYSSWRPKRIEVLN